MRKIIIYLILMIALISFVNAGVFDNLVHYYAFNDSAHLIDYIGSADSSAESITSRVATGINGDGWDFEKDSSNKVTFGSSTWDIDGKSAITINAWAKRESLVAGQRSSIISVDSGNSRFTSLYIQDANDWIARGTTAGDSEVRAGTGHANTGNTNDWVMVTLRYNGSKYALLINGIEIDALTNSGLTDTNGGGDFIGSFTTASDYFDGIIDELSMFDVALTGPEITQLYNSGAGLFYPVSVAGTPTASFNTPPSPLTGYANNTLGQNYSATCTDDGEPSIYFGPNNPPTTIVIDGIGIGLDTNSWLVNNSIITTEKIYYTYANCSNITSIASSVRTFTYDITPPEYNALQNLSSRTLTINLSNYINVTDNLSGVKTCELNFTYLLSNTSEVVDCTDTVIFSYGGYYNITLFAEDEASNILTLSDIFLIDPYNYIYLFDNKTGDPLTNSSINITYPSGNNILRITNTFGAVNFSSIVNEVLELGDYSYTILNFKGFQTPITFSETLNYTDIPVNNTYDINRARLEVFIYDREKGTLIDFQNSTINIVGLTTFITDNGTYIIENLTVSPGTFSVITNSEGYITEKQTFTYTNQEILSLNIYLVNLTSTDIGNVILTVYDNFYNFIVGASTKLLEYDVSLNSFKEVSECETNTNGECIFSVELGTKFYILQASKTINNILYEAQTTQTGEIIKADNTPLELHLQTSERFELGDLFNLQIDVTNTTLIGNTSYLTASFLDTSNVDHTVCISYYLLQGTTETELTTTCVTGSSGIVNQAGGYILNRNYNNRVKVYTNENNIITVYNTYDYPALDGSFSSEFSYYAKPIILILFILLLGLSIYLKNISMFGIGIIPLALISVILSPTLLGGITITFMILIGLIIIYLSKKKQEAF